jgi:hypothetical protein
MCRVPRCAARTSSVTMSANCTKPCRRASWGMDSPKLSATQHPHVHSPRVTLCWCNIGTLRGAPHCPCEPVRVFTNLWLPSPREAATTGTQPWPDCRLLLLLRLRPPTAAQQRGGGAGGGGAKDVHERAHLWRAGGLIRTLPWCLVVLGCFRVTGCCVVLRCVALSCVVLCVRPCVLVPALTRTYTAPNDAPAPTTSWRTQEDCIRHRPWHSRWRPLVRASHTRAVAGAGMQSEVCTGEGGGGGRGVAIVMKVLGPAHLAADLPSPPHTHTPHTYLQCCHIVASSHVHVQAWLQTDSRCIHDIQTVAP